MVDRPYERGVVNMGLFLEWLRARTNLAAVVTGVLLIGYIAFLVVMNYLSQIRLQESALVQLSQDTEKRAEALSYFCSERKNDLKDLAGSRAISAFFENKALGMSMEYGLQASLFGISKRFDSLLADRKLGGARIYTRIVFIDRGGKLLVDTQPGSEKQEHERDWKNFLTPKGPDEAMIFGHNGRMLSLMVSTPYFFKNEYAGQIIAWISSQTVYHLVEETRESSKRFVYIVCGKDIVPLLADRQYKTFLSELPDLGSIKNRETHLFKTVNKGGVRGDIFALRVPVHGTPLSLVTLLPASEVSGHMASWHLPLGMGVLAIIILGGMAITFRSNAQKLILHARLEESSRR
ncbi:MAG TPA: hypothetical protein EYP19_03525, partial [Desulfobacterales bacterium]|nr:hypothetical protein [Desulfobacterales bacterium]